MGRDWGLESSQNPARAGLKACATQKQKKFADL